MSVGYKGKIAVDMGAICAPYTYSPFEKMTWQKYLQYLQLKYASWTQLGNKTGDGLADATELMKKVYPGNYQVIEKYDSIQGKFVLKLEFEDPKEEIVWLLRWG